MPEPGRRAGLLDANPPLWHSSTMVARRSLLMLAPLAAIPRTAAAQDVSAAAARGDFAAFVAGLRPEARRAGVSDSVFNAAFAGVAPSPRVLELDRHQPEFTLTWAQYRARVITPEKIANGRAAFARARALLLAVGERFRVNPSAIAGIWGMESAFGQITGGFNVVQALATLAYDGRRAAFFRSQLIAALRILQAGDVTPAAMTGSYAGAMGQPQFMPDSYLRYAVDFSGDGRRDIWTNPADVFASIANYLAHSGWRVNLPICQPIRLPPGFDAALAGREAPRSLGAWMRLGVRRPDGSRFSSEDVPGAVVIPDGAGGEAFMAYVNFAAIRRYNPSDYYALGVGLLGDLVSA
jgi:membrane-bound lytic murein transglycosylase B